MLGYCPIDICSMQVSIGQRHRDKPPSVMTAVDWILQHWWGCVDCRCHCSCLIWSRREAIQCSCWCQSAGLARSIWQPDCSTTQSRSDIVQSCIYYRHKRSNTVSLLLKSCFQWFMLCSLFLLPWCQSCLVIKYRTHRPGHTWCSHLLLWVKWSLQSLVSHVVHM